MASTPLPFPSYRGRGRYAFICYAHEDADVVYPILIWLRDQGLNIWFDEGISPGQQWRDELATAIDGCAIFVVFLSEASVRSSNCRREINFATEQDKPTLAIHLEPVELPGGLALALGDVQGLLKYRLPQEDFRRKATQALTRFAEGEPADTAAAPVRITHPSRRLLTAIGMVLVAATALALLLLVYPFSRSLTIAVLPFENFSADPANEYISSGIAEEIINLLDKVESLDVVSRTASFYYGGKDLDLTTIARRLQADVVLEGSIRREGDRLRVAAQLINGDTGVHEWSEIFEEQIVELMLVQQTIALQVAAALETSLTEQERAAIEQPPTADREAFALYLEARNWLRTASTAGDLENARSLFAQAIARDGGFTEAQSGLCDTELAYYQRTRSSDDYARASAVCARLVGAAAPPADALVALGTLNRLSGNFAEALLLFNRAIELAPELEPAYYGRARAHQGLGDLVGAEQDLLTTIRLEPGFWQVYSGYGVFLASTGRLAEAIEQFSRVVSLTPENPQGHGNLGTALFASGRWEEAESAWQVSLDLEETPHGYINLGTAQYYRGVYADAIETFAAGLQRFPDTFYLWGKLASARWAAGDVNGERDALQRAIELVESLITINPDDANALRYLCVYRVRLGDAAGGLPLCERAIAGNPEDAETHYLHATALRLAGDRAASDQAVARAKELGYSERILAADPVFREG